MTTRTTMPVDRSRMPSRRGRPRAALVTMAGTVASVAVALAACSGGDPAPLAASTQATVVISQPGPSPTPSPSISIPSNLSPAEAEAAANAIEAYKQWVAAVDVMAQSGGADLSPLRAIAVQTALDTGIREAAMFSTRGWRVVGDRQAHWITVEEVNLKNDASRKQVPRVTLRGCMDATHTEVLANIGQAVTSGESRVYEYEALISYYPQVEFPSVGPGQRGWLVSKYENKRVSQC